MPLLSFYNPASRYRWFNLVWFFALLLFPVLFWLLPADLMDGDDRYSVCPSKLFFNVECMGCGMTRAVVHLHHLEWQDAIYYNSGVVVIYPALVLIWAIWLFKAIKREQVHKARIKKP